MSSLYSDIAGARSKLMAAVDTEGLYSLSPTAVWRKFKREHICFWLICGYLLFEYVRPQTIYPWLDFFPWTATFAVGAFLSSFLEKNRTAVPNPLSKLLIVYGSVVLLSAIFAYDTTLAFSRLDLYFIWVFVYFAIIRTVRTKSRFFCFLLLYLLCNTKMVQHGFRSWAASGFGFDRDGVGGAPGWFQNSGEFGIQLCVFIPLMVAFIFAVRSCCHKLVCAALYLVTLAAAACIVASSSRGALLGLAAIAVWSLFRKKHVVRNFLVIGALAALCYWTIPEELLGKFETSGADRTSVHRLDRWKKGWEVMREYPVLGIGHGNWEKYYASNLTEGEPGSVLIHNMFLESGTQHGFVGMGVLISVLICTFYVNKRTRELAKKQSDSFSAVISRGLDAGTIGLVVSASFVTVLYYPYVWIQVAFVAALHAAVSSFKRGT
jgi:O-antigen ligase